MADNRIIRILLEARDQATAILERATSGWRGFQLQLKSWRTEAGEILKNKLVQGIGLTGLVAGMKRAWDESDKVEASLRKLGGTAKIAGVPLEFLEDIAAKAKDSFKLSTAQSNEFAGSIVRLTSGAGRLPETEATLRALLDVGAARGLSAAESLERMNQALNGQDEGTDFLFNKNPSAIYKEWAERAGTTAAKMTDTQKYQALMDETLRAGEQVRGAHLLYLRSAAGQTEILANKTADAAAEFGLASSGLRDMLLPAATAAADGLGFLVKFVQSVGVAIGNLVWNIIDGFKGVGMVVVRFLQGDVNGAIDAARDAGKTLRDNWQSATAAVEDIWADHNKRRRASDYQAELAAVADRKKAEQARRAAAADAAKAAEEQAKERTKALEKIDELSNASTLSLLTEQHRAYLELTQKFQEEIAKLQGADRARAEAALAQAQKNLLVKWADFNKEVTPKVTHATTLVVDNTKLQGMALDNLGGVLDRHNKATGRYTAEQVEAMRKAKAWRDELLEVSGAVTGTAQRIQGLAHDLEPLFGSAFVDQIDQAVGAITEMGAAVGRIAGGDILGGVTQGVGALVSLGKTIFGSSDGLKKATTENNARLRELRQTMGDLINVTMSGRDVVGVQQALQKALPFLSGKLGSDEKRVLDRELVRMGLDRQALNDIAEALGIRIRDDNGELQADLLRQLFQAIGSLDTDWAQTHRGQRDRISQGVGIGAITDELGAAIALLTDPTLGSSAIAGALAGFDLRNADGRSGAIGALQGLFSNIGSLSVGQLGGMNRQEFTEGLQWLVELLGAATDVAADVPVPDVVSSPAPATGTSPAVDVVLSPELAPDFLASLTGIDHGITKLVQEVSAARADLPALGTGLEVLAGLGTETNLRLTEIHAAMTELPSVRLPGLRTMQDALTLAAPGGDGRTTVNGGVHVSVYVPTTMASDDAERMAARLAPLVVDELNDRLARSVYDDRGHRGDVRGF